MNPEQESQDKYKEEAQALASIAADLTHTLFLRLRDAGGITHARLMAIMANINANVARTVVDHEKTRGAKGLTFSEIVNTVALQAMHYDGDSPREVVNLHPTDPAQDIPASAPVKPEETGDGEATFIALSS